jgi:hypothetical protein
MLRLNKKKITILLIYASFFVGIPIIKNETRLIEKKIEHHQTQIMLLEKNISEAYLEFQYLSSPAILKNKVSENIDIDYKNLSISQIYLNLDDFIKEQKKLTKILINEKKEK